MSEFTPLNDIVVVKVGTSVLADTYSDGSQELNMEAFQRISRDITALTEKGSHIILITSGAITAGMSEVGINKRPDSKDEIPELQRLASIGWRPLLNAWDEALSPLLTGSLLLTKNELDLDSSERNEAIMTTYSLLKSNNIPIVNENDAITHEQIAFGDNDTLSAIYATYLSRSKLFGNLIKLVLLTNVDGVYSRENDADSVIRVIDDLDKYQHLANDTSSENGTGGMTTKFEAGRIALDAGIEMRIANGRTKQPIQKALNDVIGTKFI